MAKSLSGVEDIDGLLSTDSTGLTAVNGVALFPVLSWQDTNTLGTPVSLTYSFLNSPTNGETSNFQPMNASLMTATRTGLSHFADVANITFTEVGRGGDLQFGTANLGGGTIGIAYSGWSSNGIYNNFVYGNIYLTNARFGFSSAPVGSDSYETLLHEIGHGLGLDHSFISGHYPGDERAVPAGKDNNKYTIMSYIESYSNTVSPTTLMLLDILAIQYLYGANHNYNAGNTTVDLSDFVADGPAALWDGDGIDTLSLAGFAGGQTLSLAEGIYSSLGSDDNFVIAYGANIENATGSNAADNITGNNLDNIITGGGGNDVLEGGTGNDTAILAGNYADYTISSVAGGFRFGDSVSNRDGTDILTGFESFQFADQTVAAGDIGSTPLNGNNTFTDTTGNDVLDGGAGNDTLYASAGNDTLLGGDGDDVLFDAFGNNTLNTGSGTNIAVTFAGNSQFVGGSGNDTLLGGTGNDTLSGGDGNDVIVGDIGSSFLFGNDRIEAGGGTDLIQGGDGADTFVFKVNDGVNTITTIDRNGTPSANGADFQSGIDTIELDGFGLLNGSYAMNEISDVDGNAQFTSNGTTIIFDGLTKSDLDAGDFILV